MKNKFSLCPKCASNMEPGFLVDGIDRACYRQSQWMPGPPESDDSRFLGMRLYEEWALKIEETDLKPIVTMRCTGCGFLEHYAP